MPAVVASRPQRTEQMFQALKTHIIKERQKKKQEQEADAEVERQRKEREAQQKQNVMTLGENREQISKLEQLLAQLKDEKHQLFLKLKKVLNEEDNRRRLLVRQQESKSDSNHIEVIDLYGNIYSTVPPMGSHISQLVMHQNYPVADRNALYKVPPSHTLLPPGALKRARSPSPPPPQQTSYPQNYGQKPPSSSRVSYQKSSSYGGYYAAPGTTGGGQSSYTYSGPHFASASGRSDQPQQQPDGVSPVPPPQPKHPTYLTQPLPRPPLSQAYMHSPMEHSKPSYAEDKFYPVPPIRPATHVPVHGGVIPIQQPAQGAKTGGITSGYPIRPPASAPPPHVVSTPTTPHQSVYGNQPASTSRLVYSQAGLTPRGYGPREV